MKTSTINPVDTGETARSGESTFPILVSGELKGRWSNATQLPQIGDRVQVTFNKLGDGTIIAFFEEHGFIGVVVKPDQRPDWHVKQNGDTHPNYTVFGAEIKFLPLDCRREENSEKAKAWGNGGAR